MTIKPGSKEWNDLVRQCNKTLNDASFTAGDAAIKICPELKGRAARTDSGVDLLQRFAVEIDLGISTLLSYRRMAMFWSPEERIYHVSTTVYLIFSMRNNPDNKKLIKNHMTVEQAYAAMGYQRNNSKTAIGVRKHPPTRIALQIISEQWNDVLLPRVKRHADLQRGRDLDLAMQGLLQEVSDLLLHESARRSA